MPEVRLANRKGAAADADSATKDDREEKKARAREVRRMQTEMRALEQRIVKLEERQLEISARLEAHYGGGGDHREGRVIADDAAAVKLEVETLYSRWSELAEAIEAAGTSDA